MFGLYEVVGALHALHYVAVGYDRLRQASQEQQQRLRYGVDTTRCVPAVKELTRRVGGTDKGQRQSHSMRITLQSTPLSPSTIRQKDTQRLRQRGVQGLSDAADLGGQTALHEQVLPDALLLQLVHQEPQLLGDDVRVVRQLPRRRALLRIQTRGGGLARVRGL